jgi:AhpD family alkylhydroperoxidase
MSHYHDENDMKLLKEMSRLSPVEFKAWLALDNVVGRDDGKIPKMYRELIALAVAFTSQCPYCIEAHAKRAKLAGALREHISETAFLSAALRAGGAATHGAMALKFFDAALDRDSPGGERASIPPEGKHGGKGSTGQQFQSHSREEL